MTSATFLICLSYLIGPVLLCYGLAVIVTGRARLSIFSSKEIRGDKALLTGALWISLAVGYFVFVVWAWRFYDR